MVDGELLALLVVDGPTEAETESVGKGGVGEAVMGLEKEKLEEGLPKGVCEPVSRGELDVTKERVPLAVVESTLEGECKGVLEKEVVGTFEEDREELPHQLPGIVTLGGGVVAIPEGEKEKKVEGEREEGGEREAGNDPTPVALGLHVGMVLEAVGKRECDPPPDSVMEGEADMEDQGDPEKPPDLDPNGVVDPPTQLRVGARELLGSPLPEALPGRKVGEREGVMETVLDALLPPPPPPPLPVPPGE